MTESAESAQPVCECCEGRGWVPSEGQSLEHGSEVCAFCEGSGLLNDGSGA